MYVKHRIMEEKYVIEMIMGNRQMKQRRQRVRAVETG
jgi:hypothetical protein